MHEQNLKALSREALLELAAAGCAADTAVCRRAEALLTQQHPLPDWCVQVMLSPDLLPQIFAGLSLSDAAAGATCSSWATQWARLLAAWQYLRPKLMRSVTLPDGLSNFVVMPDGIFCCTSCVVRHDHDHESKLRFVSPEGEECQTSLSQCAFDSPFGCPTLLLHGDSLYLAEYSEDGHVRRLRLSDGIELACSPELFVPAGGLVLLNDCLFVTNDGLTSVLHAQTLQLMRSFEVSNLFEAPSMAICGGELFLPKPSEEPGDVVPGQLRVLSLDGQERRTLHGVFGKPREFVIYLDHIYMIEEPYAERESHDYCADELLMHLDEIKERAGSRVLVLKLDGCRRQARGHHMR